MDTDEITRITDWVERNSYNEFWEFAQCFNVSKSKVIDFIKNSGIEQVLCDQITLNFRSIGSHSSSSATIWFYEMSLWADNTVLYSRIYEVETQ